VGVVNCAQNITLISRDVNSVQAGLHGRRQALGLPDVCLDTVHVSPALTKQSLTDVVNTDRPNVDLLKLSAPELFYFKFSTPCI